jgi:hypothetical protein
MGIVVGNLIQSRITWNYYKFDIYDINPQKMRRLSTYILINKFILYNLPISNKMIAYTFCRSRDISISVHVSIID